MQGEVHTVEGVKAQRARAKGSFRKKAGRFFVGGVLRTPKAQRQLKFVFLIAVMMLAYIAYGYRTQILNRRYNRLNNQVKELRTRSLYFNEMRMKASRQSEILKALEEYGIELQESVVPPKVVE
ncbi:MAG: ABC transporter permease [Rikenellaceae bacterium]|nr:ABC transporter permease [Rikenellaceae bacterium]